MVSCLGDKEGNATGSGFLLLESDFNVKGRCATRFLHDPSKDTGFVGCALSGDMVRFFTTTDGPWNHEYNIEDPSKPVLTGQAWAGGLLQKGSDGVSVAEDGAESQFGVPVIEGNRLRGGP
ncbi:selenium-binding protein [Musa troglodytarum]|uniref:Selenium-binding protein n=1 Tax=Musa troglodytarum TaxID=320322 RepID=A0A9E7FNP5_9LILI|nr:selenium-binding protein [Musa troglodytarum]